VILGVALVIAGGLGIYYALTGADPIDALRRAITGQAPPESLTSSKSKGGDSTLGGVLQGTEPNTPATHGGATLGVTTAIVAIRALVAAMPGRQLVILSVRRPGAIVAGTSSESEHASGNAVDFRIMRGGTMDKRAMDTVYNVLKATPYCELCWNYKGGCTTSHTDHIHYAPLPCRAG